MAAIVVLADMICTEEVHLHVVEAVIIFDGLHVLIVVGCKEIKIQLRKFCYNLLTVVLIVLRLICLSRGHILVEIFELVPH